MTSSAFLVIVSIVLAAVILWMLGRPSRADRAARRRAGGNDDVDYDTLADAEQEVRDLDPMMSPDEAEEELPDWGPGTPKP